jgi:hypothetical protein
VAGAAYMQCVYGLVTRSRFPFLIIISNSQLFQLGRAGFLRSQSHLPRDARLSRSAKHFELQRFLPGRRVDIPSTTGYQGMERQSLGGAV